VPRNYDWLLVGPKLLCLQAKLWDQVQMVCCVGGGFSKPFATFWGVTHGGLQSSIMFNVCVDAVIRDWLCLTISEEAAGRVFSEACRKVYCFLC
jgi:hypothetical protein